MTIIDIIDIKNIRPIFFVICFMLGSLVIVCLSIDLEIKNGYITNIGISIINKYITKSLPYN